jgi:nicotinamide-nucleotide amidase
VGWGFMIECELKNRDALILNIGTELTLGVTINTNGSWLARKLTYLGFQVKRITVVRDDEEDVVEEMRRGLDKYGLIITTGGLGPTYDDSTSLFVAKALGVDLALNEQALAMVREAHRARGEELNEARIKQAMLPRGARPIYNRVGTAPGFYFCTRNKALIVSLPGPPRELQPMFEGEVEPMLRGLTGLEYLEDFIEFRGLTESSIAKIIERVAKENPSVYIKTHPRLSDKGESIIQVQLSTHTNDVARARMLLEFIKKKLLESINEEITKRNTG